MQPKQGCKGQPEEEIESIGAWLEEPPEDAGPLHSLLCHSPTSLLVFKIPPAVCTTQIVVIQMVELRGLEPLTSTLPALRSPG